MPMVMKGRSDDVLTIFRPCSADGRAACKVKEVHDDVPEGEQPKGPANSAAVTPAQGRAAHVDGQCGEQKRQQPRCLEKISNTLTALPGNLGRLHPARSTRPRARKPAAYRAQTLAGRHTRSLTWRPSIRN